MKVRLDRTVWNRARDRLLKEMIEPQSKYMEQVNNAVVGGIIRRTKSGVDIAGMKFKPYSEKYAKKKNMGAPDLVQTGQMLSRNSFKFQVIFWDRKVMLRIYMEGPHSGNVDVFTLASVHNFGMRSGRGQGFQMPQREFFGISDDIEKAVKDISVEHWREIIASLR